MAADVHERAPLVVELDLEAILGLRHFRDGRRGVIVDLFRPDERDAIGNRHFSAIVFDRNPLAPFDGLANVAEPDLGQLGKDAPD